MRVLALDTALDHCQAAVVALPEGAVLGASSAPSEGDSEAIIEHVDAALSAAGVAFGGIDRIGVTVGPGSFTGVRVGIACARGLAFALAVPAAGVSTLAAMARQVDAPVLAAVDARHGAVFAGLFPDPLSAPVCMGRMAVADALALASEAAVTVAANPSAVAALGTGERIGRLDPVAIARAAAAQSAPAPPRALYLAPVDATPPRHKSLARA